MRSNLPNRTGKYKGLTYAWSGTCRGEVRPARGVIAYNRVNKLGIITGLKIVNGKVVFVGLYLDSQIDCEYKRTQVPNAKLKAGWESTQPYTVGFVDKDRVQIAEAAAKTGETVTRI